jgi:hypothetical protein
MGRVLNRRNAVLGWGVWQVAKRSAKFKGKGARPSVGGGRPNKPMLAIGIASLAGALTFWRRHRAGDESTSASD